MEELLNFEGRVDVSLENVWVDLLLTGLRASQSRPAVLASPAPLLRPLILTSIDCDAHRVPRGHPECPERLVVIRNHLHRVLDRGINAVDWSYVRAAFPNLLPALIHSRPFLDSLGGAMRGLRESAEQGIVQDPLLVDAVGRVITGDTYITDGTIGAVGATSAALRAAVSALLWGDRLTAAVLTRPPGHHCSHLSRLNQAQMGFCVLNTAMQVREQGRAIMPNLS